MPRTGQTHRTPLAALAILVLLTLSPMASAGFQAEVPDEKLESLAKAYVQVAEIQDEYRVQIEAAQSPAEAQQLQEEANQVMVEAIDDAEGITLEEYNTIIQAAQADEELLTRLNEHIQREIG